MQKFFGYLLTPFYLLFFGLTLLVFQPLQVIAYELFGQRAQQKMVYGLNWTAMRCMHILGGSLVFDFDPDSLPKNRKLVFVANHQSMNDIPPMIWFFRRFRPVFIAKKELAKGVPSISYNYKRGGAVAIDRKDGVQARKAILSLGKRLREEPISVCIFPEGTRARNGRLKPFQTGGIKTLLQEVPDAVFVPLAIANSWRLVEHGFWPIPAGIRIRFKVLPVVDATGMTAEQVVEELHRRIASQLEQPGYNV